MIAEINRQLSKVPYANVLGVKALIVEGDLQLVLPFLQDNIGNPMLPALHGGVIGGFMETAAIAQLSFAAGIKTEAKPIGINVDYLRRGKPVETYAKAIITKHGSRVANVRVTAWQEDAEKPIATLHGHFMLTPEDE